VPLGRQGQLDAAPERLQRAAELNPPEASCSPSPGQGARGRPAQPAASLQAAAQAAERDPGTVQYPLFAARQSQAAGLPGEATRWYRRAIDTDPNDPLVFNEAAVYFLDSIQAAAVVDVARRLCRPAGERGDLARPGAVAGGAGQRR
jgi:Flp pilus assembly protein TadD